MERYVPIPRADSGSKYSGGDTQGRQHQYLQLNKTVPNSQDRKVNHSKSGNGNGKINTKGKEDRKIWLQGK